MVTNHDWLFLKFFKNMRRVVPLTPSVLFEIEDPTNPRIYTMFSIFNFLVLFPY